MAISVTINRLGAFCEIAPDFGCRSKVRQPTPKAFDGQPTIVANVADRSVSFTPWNMSTSGHPNDPLCQLIARKLRRKWSPQQIAGRLERKHPDEEQHRVSHETIYRSLYVQTRGVLKKELQQCLRSPRALRRSRHATQKGLKLRKIKDALPISERPPEVEDWAVPGHWEGD